MLESKIDATHRLQKDGRWDEACEFRAEQRQKFREQGLTKKEANEKAWEAMRKAYPEPPDEAYAQCLDKLGERHLPCLDSKTFSFLSVYGNVTATLHRLCPSEMLRVHKPTGISRLEPQTALPPESSEYTAELLKYAMEHPVDFLAYCGEALEEGVDAIPDEDESYVAEEMRCILPEFAWSVPAIQRVIQKRFAGALCG